MNTPAEKNRDSWNRFAGVYSEFIHSNKMLARIKANLVCGWEIRRLSSFAA